MHLQGVEMKIRSTTGSKTEALQAIEEEKKETKNTDKTNSGYS